MSKKTLIGYIKGPQGLQGEQGPKGDKGDTGATGLAGVGIASISPDLVIIDPDNIDGEATVINVNLTDGSTSKFTVYNGSKGSDGKSAYEYAEDGGYTGTEAEFAVELNYVEGATGNIQTQLNAKAADYSIELYNGNKGNPKPVKFATVDYSTCGSENGVAVKISMVSGHGNGTSYAFMQDAIIRVNYQGGVSVTNIKTYGADAGTYDGATRQYGDIFWVNDTTNKVVDFYCLMGQYARVNMTPFKRVTYSTGGTITQHKTASVYSSGTIEWANNEEIATKSDIPTTPEAVGADASGSANAALTNANAYTDTHSNNKSNPHEVTAAQVGALPLGGGTMTGSLEFNGGDQAGSSKMVLATGKGQITNSGTQTLFGFLNDTDLATGHTSYNLKMRGKATRPTYNNGELALKSDIPAQTTESWTFTLEDGTTVTKAVYVG